MKQGRDRDRKKSLGQNKDDSGGRGDGRIYFREGEREGVSEEGMAEWRATPLQKAVQKAFQTGGIAGRNALGAGSSLECPSSSRR